LLDDYSQQKSAGQPAWFVPQQEPGRLTASDGLVSAIIPCYNQAHFLGQAIESVLQQDYPHFEVIVVDDGSTDNTMEVAAWYPGVRIIRQEHQGIAAARNRGIRESSGSYLVFLDSDDRLLPHALGVGLKYLLDEAKCAFAFGNYREIATDGSLLSTPQPITVEKDSYRQLLLSCYVHTPSTAIFRRTVVEKISGFDSNVSFAGAEDYDLYLRIAKEFPIFGYSEIVAEYRRHDANLSSNSALMLKGALAVLREQLHSAGGNKHWEEACRVGIRHCRRAWGERLVSQVWTRIREKREWKRSAQDVVVLLRHGPEVVPRQLGRKLRRGVEAAWKHQQNAVNNYPQ
jgi:glycosyltransferase involved in cell wall biosynthesis